MSKVFTIEDYEEKINRIYSLTSAEGGYKGGFHRFGDSTLGVIVTYLVKKGVLVREGNNRKNYTYHWKEGLMAPTPLFCKNAMMEIRSIASNKERKSYAKKSGNPLTESKPVAESPVVAKEAENTEPVVNVLSKFSVQELWDEMKARGAKVRGGVLVVVTEVELV